jgi:hypothetical protein
MLGLKNWKLANKFHVKFQGNFDTYVGTNGRRKKL